MEMLSAGVD